MDIYEKNIMERDNLGINGEFALAYLLKNESEPIDKEMVIQNEDTTDSLLSQSELLVELYCWYCIANQRFKKNKLFTGKI